MKLDITKINLNDINLIKLGAGVLFSIILIVDLFLFSSLLQNIGDAKAQRDKEAATLVYFKNLVVKKDKLSKVQIIAQEDVDSLLDKIQKTADKKNVVVKIGLSLEKDKDFKSNGAYDKRSFSLEADGPFKDVGEFLTTLRDMPGAVLDVQSINLTSDAQDPSNVQAKINYALFTTKYEDNQ